MWGSCLITKATTNNNYFHWLTVTIKKHVFKETLNVVLSLDADSFMCPRHIVVTAVTELPYTQSMPMCQYSHLYFNKIIDLRHTLFVFSTILLPTEPRWSIVQSIIHHSFSPRHKHQPSGRLFNHTQSHQSLLAPNSVLGEVMAFSTTSNWSQTLKSYIYFAMFYLAL